MIMTGSLQEERKSYLMDARFMDVRILRTLQLQGRLLQRQLRSPIHRLRTKRTGQQSVADLSPWRSQGMTEIRYVTIVSA
jgi:hypothetical protein